MEIMTQLFKHTKILMISFTVINSYCVIAAPHITNIEGSFLHGESAVITGAGFGSKGGSDANKPLVWADFETSLNPTSLGTIHAWYNNTSHISLTAENQHGTSNQGARGDLGYDYFGSPSPSTVQFEISGDYNTLYVSAKRRYDFDHSLYNFNHKNFRIWNSTYTSSAEYNYFNGQNGRWEPDAEAKAYWADDDQLPKYQWDTYEYFLKIGTGSADGDFIFNISSRNILDLKNTVTYSASGTNKPTIFTLQDDIVNEASYQGPLWVYYNDIYIDNTYAHVVIGDSSTWSGNIKKEIQIPSRWNNDSITVTINHGDFNKIKTSGKYLYVIDASGQVNSHGYPLCSKCPISPSLTVD